MARYQGFVSILKEDGRAEVVIQPGNPGIVGAPELNDKVCHCASDGSTVTIEAVNSVGAEVGDWVSVTRKTGALLRNAMLALGIPLLGMIGGIAVASPLTSGFSVDMPAGILSIGVGLAIGLFLGITAFRRFSADAQPTIDEILRRREEVASLLEKCAASPQTTYPGCEACHLSFK